MSSIHQVHRYSGSTYTGLKLINDVSGKDLLRFDWEKASQIDSGGIKYQQETAIHLQARRLSVSEKLYTASWRSSFFSPPRPFIVFSEDAAKQIRPVASRDLPLHHFKDWYVSMEYGYQDSSCLELPPSLNDLTWTPAQTKSILNIFKHGLCHRKCTTKTE